MSNRLAVPAKKSLSQNFLIDPTILHAIVEHIHPQVNEHLIEIGPGTGALTQYLYDRAPHLLLIELDDRLILPLQQRFPTARLIHQDVLTVDFANLHAFNADGVNQHAWRIVGNLPYQISTPLLFKLLESTAPIQDLTFLLQKEVVERLVAAPSSGEYGRLTVMIQAYFHTQKLLDIGPEAFQPSPKVDSALVRLTPRSHRPAEPIYAALKQITQTAFNQRRKTLRNSLKNWQHLLCECSIDNQLRPENLSVDDFLRLAGALHQFQSNGG